MPRGRPRESADYNILTGTYRAIATAHARSRSAPAPWLDALKLPAGPTGCRHAARGPRVHRRRRGRLADTKCGKDRGASFVQPTQLVIAFGQFPARLCERDRLGALSACDGLNAQLVHLQNRKGGQVASRVAAASCHILHGAPAERVGNFPTYTIARGQLRPPQRGKTCATPKGAATCRPLHRALVPRSGRRIATLPSSRT